MAGQHPGQTEDHNRDWDLSAPRTAGLLIEVFPVGKAGIVGVAVHNAGPASLSQDEAVMVLRRAAEQLAVSATWRG